MIVFWILTIFLFGLAAGFVLWPVLSYKRIGAQQALEERVAQGRKTRQAVNVALYKDKQNELEADLNSGAMSQDEYEETLLELQQNLLADVDDESVASGSVPRAAKKGKSKREKGAATGANSWMLPLVMVVLIPLIAYPLYLQWGFIRDVELMELFERTVNNTDDVAEAQALIIELGEIVRASDDGTGPNNLNDGNEWVWFFLGRNFSSLGMFAEAEAAFYQSSRRLEEGGEKAMVLGNYAMMNYVINDRQIDQDLQQIIDEGLKNNPNDRGLLELLSIDAEIREDWEEAIDYWRLLIQQDPNSQQARTFRGRIAQAQILLGDNGQNEGATPVVDVRLAIAEGLELDGNLRVFIAARNAAREGMPPLAAQAVTVAELPTTIRLDDSSAVGPFNLSSADSVYISALVSNTGVATPRSGDYRVVSETFSHNGQHALIDLVISDQVP